MKNLMLGTLVGLILGLILAGNVATAQAPARLYATDATTGAAVPVPVTSGAVHIIAP